MAYSNPKSLQNLGGLPISDPARRVGLPGEGAGS